MNCPSAALPALARPYRDIDFVTTRRDRGRLGDALSDLGYVPHTRFNALHGMERLSYFDPTLRLQIDIFVDKIAMCHVLDVRDRLSQSDLTLSGTDLLLSKLQIVEMTERDLKDISAILLDLELERERLLEVLAGDWGWWRTVMNSLIEVKRFATTLSSLPRASQVIEAASALEVYLNQMPKTRRWRLRAAIGERLRWYELPDEGIVGPSAEIVHST